MDKHEKKEEITDLLKPDYSSELYDSDDDDDDYDDDDEESLSDIDEGKEDEETEDDSKRIINNFNNRSMVTTPFITQSSTPTWGAAANNSWSNSSSSGSNAWAQPQQQSRPMWGSTGTTTMPWNNSSNNSSSGGVEIDRSKKVIITDFQDIVAETIHSNGSLGLVPRGIYDLKPKLQLWTKIGAYNPEKIYILCKNYGGDRGLWNSTFSYFCMALSSFLGFSHLACQAIVMSDGVTKSDHINFILNNPEFPICKSEAVYIGVNSGFAGQSNIDRLSAEKCGIDYVDAVQLQDKMY